MRSVWSIGLVLVSSAFAQSAKPAFEVASVKAVPAPEPYHWSMSPGTLRLRSMNLKQCILTAYQVQDFQVEGGPGWTDSERFDIDAKASYPAKRDELLSLLRGLLADRFQLTLRTRPHVTDGYTLTVAKGGLKIPPDVTEGSPAIQVNRGSMTVARFPMIGLAGALSNILQLPVEDRTGLSGSFGFNLAWTPQDNRPGVVPAAEELSISLPEALQEKVGLRLERGRVNIPIYVIEHAQKPAEN